MENICRKLYSVDLFKFQNTLGEMEGRSLPLLARCTTMWNQLYSSRLRTCSICSVSVSSLSYRVVQFVQKVLKFEKTAFRSLCHNNAANFCLIFEKPKQICLLFQKLNVLLGIKIKNEQAQDKK